ncbi:MAG TPA: hypothetical protein VKQ36_06235, partial [Ktedonobacterales bacterium]|nr:hypothetical protein [Ktedonobacterales bacterium]
MADNQMMSQASFPLDDDDAQNTFSVIREPLDAPSGLHDPSSTAAPRPDTSDANASPLAWEQRLTMRGKLWRGTITLLMVALACTVIIGSSPLRDLFTRKNTPPPATQISVPTVEFASFQLLTTPFGAAHNLAITVAPTNESAK